jgi:multidrug resistance efflux pump
MFPVTKRLAGLALVALVLALVLVYSQRGSGPFKVSGLIEADEIRIGSRVGGRVARVRAVEGQTVAAGDVLVELEPFDLLERRAEAEKLFEARKAEYQKLTAGFRSEEIAQAQAHRDQLAARLQKLETGPRKQEIASARAQLSLAKAELELAHAKHDRVRKLTGGAVSREELDRVESEVKTAQQRALVRDAELALLQEGTRPEEIAEARAQLEEADQAWKLRRQGYRPEDIAQARAAMEAAQATRRALDRQLEELTIRAPVAATVEAVELQPGDLVGANAPVLSLLDARTLWVRAYVPENRLTIQVNQKVRVTVDSFPGEPFAGHISYIARQAEFTPGNVQTPEERSKQVFRIKVTLDEGLDRLKPGMSADVWLEPGETRP